MTPSPEATRNAAQGSPRGFPRRHLEHARPRPSPGSITTTGMTMSEMSRQRLISADGELASKSRVLD